MVYGIVASFRVLMQSFYKSRIGMKRFQHTTTRIEGTLNQIRFEYPYRLDSAAMAGHLREQLCHGMKKGIRDSL